MLHARVKVRRPAVMARQRQHSRVLAGAVRVDGREPYAPARVVPGHGFGERRVGTAQQIALAAPDLPQQIAHDRHVLRLARVRRAAQRELFSREGEPLEHPVRGERQGLERLRRRAPVGDEVGIAHVGNELAGPVDHGDVDVVPGFDRPSPELFNPHGHAPSPVLSSTTARSPPARVSRRSPSRTPAPRVWPAPATRSRSRPPAPPARRRSRSSRGSV